MAGGGGRGNLSIGSITRGTRRPYLHQETEGPSSLVLQDSKLHTSWRESKVFVKERSGPPDPSRQTPLVLLPCVSAEAAWTKGLWQ